MIITRTPLRVSFVGGGSDMPTFYKNSPFPGHVVSTTIDKYIYICVNPKFDRRIRVSYSITENCDLWREIKHDLVREALKMFQLKGIEVVSISDIPGDGSGLGSSSAFAVGLINALSRYAGSSLADDEFALAEEAWKLEAMIHGTAIGKQDLYAAAFGGLKHYTFKPDHVVVEQFSFLDEELDFVASRMMLFWTREKRNAREILRAQSKNFSAEESKSRLAAGHIAQSAYVLSQAIGNGMLFRIGPCVRDGWDYKRNLADGVTNQKIDGLVETAMSAGADGAKICGAGGGGFLLVIAEPELHDRIKRDMLAHDHIESMPIKIETEGSKVIYGP